MAQGQERVIGGKRYSSTDGGKTWVDEAGNPVDMAEIEAAVKAKAQQFGKNVGNAALNSGLQAGSEMIKGALGGGGRGYAKVNPGDSLNNASAESAAASDLQSAEARDAANKQMQLANQNADIQASREGARRSNDEFEQKVSQGLGQGGGATAMMAMNTKTVDKMPYKEFGQNAFKQSMELATQAHGANMDAIQKRAEGQEFDRNNADLTGANAESNNLSNPGTQFSYNFFGKGNEKDKEAEGTEDTTEEEPKTTEEEPPADTPPEKEEGGNSSGGIPEPKPPEDKPKGLILDRSYTNLQALKPADQADIKAVVDALPTATSEQIGPLQQKLDAVTDRVNADSATTVKLIRRTIKEDDGKQTKGEDKFAGKSGGYSGGEIPSDVYIKSIRRIVSDERLKRTRRLASALTRRF